MFLSFDLINLKDFLNCSKATTLKCGCETLSKNERRGSLIAIARQHKRKISITEAMTYIYYVQGLDEHRSNQ